MPDVAERAFALDPAMLAVGFADTLRRAGVPSTPERAAWLAEALRLVPPHARSDLYWTCRTVFITSQHQLERFDRVFEAVFGGETDTAEFRGDPNAPPALRHRPAQAAGREVPSGGVADGTSDRTMPASSSDRRGEEEATDAFLLAASLEERLHDTSFDALTPAELARMRRLVGALVLATPTRPGRRERRSPRARDRLDLRRTVRAARRTGGHASRLIHAARQPRARPLVLLCDVSASMEPYTRVFLSLLHAAVTGGRAEAFVFATRLTRLTRPLATRDPDRALERAADAARDWAGGTRLATGIRTFIDEYGRRGIARGAVIVILSDGWSQDEPAEIEREMARLSRLAHRIVWVNPRRAAPGFAPLTGGMAAALPHCDAFVSGHSYTALHELVRVIADDGASTTRTRRN